MHKFDEKALLKSAEDTLALKPEIEKIVDDICKEGYKNIFLIGVGGTICYAWQMEAIVKAHSTIDLTVVHAADYLSMGYKRLTKDTIVICESASGDTKEIVAAIEKVHSIGAKVIGLCDKPESPVGKSVDYRIGCPDSDGMYKWYVLMCRFMKNNGDFDQYDEFFKDMANLPAACIEVSKACDEKTMEFAKMHADDDVVHYLVGSGNLWGGTYSEAMCLMEEMQWMRTKSITAGDLFHGTIEIIDPDTSMLLFFGEDETRPQMQRVLDFLPRINKNHWVFDTKDYELKGIRPEFRGLVSPIVMWAVNMRLANNLELMRCHPLEVRRYYRKLKY
ncbi:MAG: SIS domain-containing protein [Oscillospiraceae bacterium]|nr:SIS domain-containing protein [Oscillospiraceae bacterium]MDY4192598.1 SIS domain-containing protein [Oscillospiraceae bacterium]